MPFITRLLLGSAAAVTAVAAAQAADLPTRKGEPAAEYVKLCNIGGVAGFVIPGTDTCLKISGLITAQTTLGSTATNHAIASPTTLSVWSGAVAGSSGAARAQDAYGMYIRVRVIEDSASNTAYGPLLSHIESEFNWGSGFDSNADNGQLNEAYLQWAGITAGVDTSFFDYLGGGYAWDNLLSPNHTGTPTAVLAYTATFGGGLAATVSLEDPQIDAAIASPNAQFGDLQAPSGRLGFRAPDIVGAVDLKQGWGGAHLAGVLHNARLEYSALGASSDTDFWGWGVIGGLTLNTPMLGAKADLKLQASYTDGAQDYSGFFAYDAFNPGAFNLSGVAFDGATADAYYDAATGAWVRPKTWTAAALAELPLGDAYKIVPEISYGEDRISTPANSSLSSRVSEWVGGAVLEWTPVKNLVFDLDLLYATGHQDKPDGYSGAGAFAWKSNFDGFNGKLRIERDF